MKIQRNRIAIDSSDRIAALANLNSVTPLSLALNSHKMTSYLAKKTMKLHGSSHYVITLIKLEALFLLALNPNKKWYHLNEIELK